MLTNKNAAGLQLQSCSEGLLMGEHSIGYNPQPPDLSETTIEIKFIFVHIVARTLQCVYFCMEKANKRCIKVRKFHSHRSRVQQHAPAKTSRERRSDGAAHAIIHTDRYARTFDEGIFGLQRFKNAFLSRWSSGCSDRLPARLCTVPK
jgi:hypothetical protein